MKLPPGQARVHALDGLPIAEVMKRLGVSYSTVRHTRTNIVNKLIERPLSERQTEVLFCISQGLVDKEIATKLGMGLSTVKSHKTAIRARLGLAAFRRAVYRNAE